VEVARALGKLTALGVDRAKRRGYYGDGGGLFLQVSNSGAKSWVFRFKEGGRLREMGLGATHTVGLAEAREKARECRQMRLGGIDPIEARKAGRAQARFEAQNAMTFKSCAERHIAVHKAGWRNPKHAAQWPNTLSRYVYPIFGDLPVQAVDIGLVMKVLESIWTDKPETASRVRGRIESVLDWATARGYRQGENPARWRGHLENLLPKKSKIRRVEHHAGVALCRDEQLYGRSRAERRCVGSGTRIRDPDRSEVRRGDRRQMAGNQLRRAAMDGAGRAHEARQGTPGAAVRVGDCNPRADAEDPARRFCVSRC
jgi:hypothetical protein